VSSADDALFDADPYGSDSAAPPEPTWSVTELHEALDGLLAHAFGDEIWVEGELRNFKRSQKQHVYFDLVDTDPRGGLYPPMLAVTLFDRERQSVNRFLGEQGGKVRMGDGVRVRIRGRLTTYPSRSSLQLRMSWIDPTYTLGVLDQERDRLLAQLATDGVLRANAATHLDPVPLRLALITSAGSAAHADALDELTRSELGFTISLLDARMQGADAERSICAALRTAQHLPVDLILLTRGGGARTDLASFDTEAVARTIATSTVPVFTGIGHEIDRTVADEVAHTAHKTPTACAAAVVAQVRSAVENTNLTWARIAVAAQGRLELGDRRLSDSGRRAGRAALRHLDRDQQRTTHLWHRAALAAPRAVNDAATALDTATRRIGRSSAHTVELAQSRLDTLAARARVHDPVTALARGWSITRTAQGTVVRDADALREGDVLVTQLGGGTVTSVVESTRPDPDPAGANTQEQPGE
jgi:exodeoxyribonuclease VII large subunit